MHEPLFVGFSLPLLTRDPCSLRRMQLLVEMEGQLHQVLRSGQGDGGDNLHKLLGTLRQLARVMEDMARQMFQVSGPRQVSGEENLR